MIETDLEIENVFDTELTWLRCDAIDNAMIFKMYFYDARFMMKLWILDIITEWFM